MGVTVDWVVHTATGITGAAGARPNSGDLSSAVIAPIPLSVFVRALAAPADEFRFHGDAAGIRQASAGLAIAYAISNDDDVGIDLAASADASPAAPFTPRPWFERLFPDGPVDPAGTGPASASFVQPLSPTRASYYVGDPEVNGTDVADAIRVGSSAHSVLGGKGNDILYRDPDTGGDPRMDAQRPGRRRPLRHRRHHR